MDAIPLCFNIEVYVFTSITQQKKVLKYQLYFSYCMVTCFGCAYSHLQGNF